MSFTYRKAGVDIDAGEALVARIKPLAQAVTRPEVLGGIGGFAGLCSIPGKYKEPILVSGTDGVGTKLKWAFMAGKHDTVGIDLVAMCVNDILVVGAEPLFFLDYFGTGRLDVEVGEKVVAGIAEGCRISGCALLGGETAELPGMYADGEYDLAGFAVGVVEKAELRHGRDLQAGDLLVAIASDGIHSNGHSLVRKVILEGLKLGLGDWPDALGGRTVAEEVLRPTKIYVPAFRALAAAGVRFKGAAHITGGGLVENPTRFVPAGMGLGLRIDERSWEVPAIFRMLAGAGVAHEEMRRTFNMGVGMIVAVAAGDGARAIQALTGAGERAWAIGEVVESALERIEFA